MLYIFFFIWYLLFSTNYGIITFDLNFVIFLYALKMFVNSIGYFNLIGGVYHHIIDQKWWLFICFVKGIIILYLWIDLTFQIIFLSFADILLVAWIASIWHFLIGCIVSWYFIKKHLKYLMYILNDSWLIFLVLLIDCALVNF